MKPTPGEWKGRWMGGDTATGPAKVTMDVKGQACDAPPLMTWPEGQVGADLG